MLEPEPDGGYACNFVPVKEGKAVLEVSSEQLLSFLSAFAYLGPIA